MLVKIKKLSESAVVPKYSKKGDCGMDLTATSYKFENGRHVYGTDLAIEIPDGFVGLIYPRSSICKYDLRLTNSVGVIDSNYRGEIVFQFENDSMSGREFITENTVDVKTNSTDYLLAKNQYIPKIYKVGDRVGQLIIHPVPKIEFMETQFLSDTNRGQAGFGSSGK